jgi:hypothetical protein
MKVFRDKLDNGNIVTEEIFDIIECTYSGKFMGERSITATIQWASPIDFQIGDYIDMEMQSYFSTIVVPCFSDIFLASRQVSQHVDVVLKIIFSHCHLPLCLRQSQKDNP